MDMEMMDVITGKNIKKKFGKFVLDIPELHVPKGYATALIGENGAGKSTLMNILSGVRLDYHGEVQFFQDTKTLGTGTLGDKQSAGISSKRLAEARERIGFTTPNDYYMPNWTIKQAAEASEVLFDHFHRDRFEQYLEVLNIPTDKVGKKWKKISELSDGNRMKLEIAGVLARDTDLLLMDEPASPLDPLMRDKLCDIIREYIEQGNGERTVFFSTHNISDMENVTDYVILMENGEIIETGFTEDLKEKYILVKADADMTRALKPHMYGAHCNQYGVQGLMKREQMDLAESCQAAIEVPSLSEIVVALMKQYTELKF